MLITTQDSLYPGMQTTWSPCRSYRYFLRRPWAEQIQGGFADLTHDANDRPPIAFLLLNPSTADEVKDDPTVARCRRFAVAWGYGEVIVMNAFAYRATDPKDMRAQADPVGPDNDTTIRTVIPAVLGLGGKIVCGWGNHGAHLDRSTKLRSLLAVWQDLDCFPKTKSGEPGHPLYLKNSVQLDTLN